MGPGGRMVCPASMNEIIPKTRMLYVDRVYLRVVDVSVGTSMSNPKRASMPMVIAFGKDCLAIESLAFVG